MPVSETLKERIEDIIQGNDVVLFMKGNREAPQCGFSSRVVAILNSMTDNYRTVDVLADEEMRSGIKDYSDWPTIPQLYANGEFIGGCDLVEEMAKTNDLYGAMGLDKDAINTLQITVTEAAVVAIEEVKKQNTELSVHLNIDDNWVHEFSLSPLTGNEIVAESNGLKLCFNFRSAKRANGLTIDMESTPDGNAFSITNPNAPPSVSEITVQELKSLLDEHADLYLFDVRESAEREIAFIEGSLLLDEAAVKYIDTLDRDDMLVFQCHTGIRSRSAAEYFRDKGYSRVFNLVGGIDAWSKEIDSDIPCY
jgi:monothiol glutaredoxin